MKILLIVIMGGVILANSTTGLAPFLGCALIAWAYYLLGHADGVKEGKRYILTGKSK